MNRPGARQIVFWQVHPSIHQAAFVRALSAMLPKGRVSCVFARELDPARRAMGWPEPDYGGACVIIERDLRQVIALFERHRSHSAHIFSSMQAEPQIAEVCRRALDSRGDCRVGLMTEGFDPRGLTGIARKLRSRLLETRLLATLDFILAIGSAERWFRDLGMSPERCFPFPYVVDAASDDCLPHDIDHNGVFQIAFAGALIPRKNVRELLRALEQLQEPAWRLVVVGDGPDRGSLAHAAAAAGLSTKVSFVGGASNERVRKIVAASDLLVLPSRWDGWGAVVNEALAHGVPVLCSDFCGAAELVRPGLNGDVFPLGDAAALQAKIRGWIGRGKPSLAQRLAVRNWSQSIGGPSIAEYLLAIIDHVDGARGARPMPPWLDTTALARVV